MFYRASGLIERLSSGNKRVRVDVRVFSIPASGMRSKSVRIGAEGILNSSQREAFTVI
jgi:hypothetical protein